MVVDGLQPAEGVTPEDLNGLGAGEYFFEGYGSSVWMVALGEVLEDTGDRVIFIGECDPGGGNACSVVLNGDVACVSKWAKWRRYGDAGSPWGTIDMGSFGKYEFWSKFDSFSVFPLQGEEERTLTRVREMADFLLALSDKMCTATVEFPASIRNIGFNKLQPTIVELKGSVDAMRSMLARWTSV